MKGSNIFPGSERYIASKACAVVLAGLLTCGLAGCASQNSTAGAESAGSSEPAQTSVVEPAVRVDKTITVESDQQTTPLFDAKEEGLCSWSMGGTDASSVEGNDYAFTPVAYVNGGSYDAQKSLAGDQLALNDGKLSNTGILIKKVGVNGIVINNSALELDNVSVDVQTPDADGSTTCDFSGLGAAFAAYGSSDVRVSNSKLSTSGVANLAVFCDNGAKVLLDKVALSSAGGTLYKDYVNSPKQTLMVAPPWILGIMGTSRTTNEMGTNSTMTVVDSSASASNWAVLSTDAGSNMHLNVVNTTMNLTGTDKPFQEDDVFNVENPYTKKTGYGTYAIGDAVENFLGVQMNVGTYATIFTGGSGYYGNLKAGQSYDLAAADGSTHHTYVADQDVKTVIESDTFGFMSHKSSNKVDIDGATVHSAYTGFLMKSGANVDVTVRGGAEIKADNGILVQAMDNDDSTTAYDSENDAFATTHEENAGFPTEAVSGSSSSSSNAGGGAPSGGQDGQKPQDEGGAPSNGSNGPSGAPTGEPPSGAPGGQSAGQNAQPPSGGPGDQNGQPPSAGGSGNDAGSGPGGEQGGSGGTNTSSYTIEDCNLEGSIYNGVGWKANELSEGNVSPMTLNVNLSGTSTLKGAIASTSCVHASYDGQQYLKENGITAFDNDNDAAAFAQKYQLTSFTKAEYFNIGQVANLVKSNGLNTINVTLSGDSVWTVTDTSLIASLKIEGNAKVTVEKGITLTVADKTYPEGTYTASDFA